MECCYFEEFKCETCLFYTLIVSNIISCVQKVTSECDKSDLKVVSESMATSCFAFAGFVVFLFFFCSCRKATPADRSCLFPSWHFCFSCYFSFSLYHAPNSLLRKSFVRRRKLISVFFFPTTAIRNDKSLRLPLAPTDRISPSFFH